MARLALLLFLLCPAAAFAGSSEFATLGLRVQDSEDPKGLLINEVQTGSTAYFAGFQPGDLIVAIDHVYLEAEGMPSRIGFFKSGDQLGVTWRFIVDGELSEEPIRTALMVGAPGSGPWLSQVELGPLVGTPYPGHHPYRDIRYYERFEWPNRRPIAGLPEAIQKAVAAFPAILEDAEAKITALSCKTDVKQATTDEAITALSRSLTFFYYTAYGMIETNYDTALRETNRKACAAECAAKPRDPWTLAGTSAGKEPKPNACQILLAFDEFLTARWKKVWDVSYNCSAIREQGCTLSGSGRSAEARITKFGKVACRGANHECDFSYDLGCKGRINGIYDPTFGSPTTCGAVGIDPVGTFTANFVVGSDGHWTLVPLAEPKKNAFAGKTEDIDVLCPLAVEAMRCVQNRP